ncbi:MAG TPA: SHD1 domain-containing protein [Pirellulaceae bacterium]|jgi:hypothetical protein|nr:SHD1 domain-containing protein [Pirellulaceae bacterium]
MSYGYYQPPPPKTSNTWIFVLLGCLFGGGLLIVAVCAGIGIFFVSAVGAAADAAREREAQQVASYPSFNPASPTAPSFPGYVPPPTHALPPAFATPTQVKIDSFDTAIAALNSGDIFDDREAVEWLAGQPVDAIHKADVMAGLVACLERKSQVREVMPQLIAWAGTDAEALLLGYLLDPASAGHDSFVLEESMRILHERNHPELVPALVGLVKSGDVRSFEARRYLKLAGPSAEDDLLPVMNVANHGARSAARELLDEFGTSPEKRTAQCLADLDSADETTRQEAARYLREKGVFDSNSRQILLTKLEPVIQNDRTFHKFDDFSLYLAHATLDNEEFVMACAEDGDHRVSNAAMKWLGEKASPRGLAMLGKAFVDPRMRPKAAPALKAAGPAAEEILLPLVDGGDLPTQLEALRTLEAVGTERTVTELQKKLRAAINRREIVMTRPIQDAIEALKIRLTLEARRGGGSGSSVSTSATSRSLESRTWTDATGSYTIEATFVRRSGDSVTIRRQADGGEVDLPLEQLSDADRKYVDSVD